jgi:hypothetical protein
MTSRPPRRHDPQVRSHRLANWLALLALLALGVVWPGDESAGVAAQGAQSAVDSAWGAASGTAIRQAQAPVGHALP